MPATHVKPTDKQKNWAGTDYCVCLVFFFSFFLKGPSVFLFFALSDGTPPTRTGDKEKKPHTALVGVSQYTLLRYIIDSLTTYLSTAKVISKLLVVIFSITTVNGFRADAAAKTLFSLESFSKKA